MAQYAMQMLSFLSSQEEGPFSSQAGEKGKPENLTDGGHFKHYRRKKTNKAPRKRTFIANMTKQPTILTDSLASSAQGIGKGLGVTLSSATSTNDSSGSATTPTGAAGSLQALQQQQRYTAEAALQGLPVLYPPVVYGTKHAPAARSPPPQHQHSSQSQPFYYDAELAAALADYHPTGAAPQTVGSAAFRAVTTALDELPPSTMARSICTGLVQYAAPPAPAPEAAQQMPAAEPAAAARASSMQAQAAAAPAPSSAYHPMLSLMGYDAASAAAAAAAAAAAYMKPAQRQTSPFSRISPSAQSTQQQVHSQASSMSSLQSQLTRLPSENSMRTSVGTGHSFTSPAIPTLQAAATAIYPAAPLPQQPDRVHKAEAGSGSGPSKAAAPSQLLVLPLEPSGWSQLPPRAAQPAWPAAGHADDEQLWNPSRVICHTLINTGAYGCVYKGSLRADEDVSLSRASPFVEVAVKCLRPGLSPAKLLRSFQVEAELLPSLSHPHVVPVWYVNADPAAGAVCLVQELAPLGTLADYIHGRPHSLPQQQVERAVLTRLATQLNVSAAQLMQRLGCGGAPGDAEAPAQAQLRRQLVLLCLLRDVACALDYLATLPQAVVHRDVKPANVLISAQGTAMLADFGVAKLAPRAEPPRSQGWAGADESLLQSKRRRVSDNSSQHSAQRVGCAYSGYGSSPASDAYSPPMSSAPSSPDASEETSWLNALLSDDLPVDAAFAHGDGTDEDSLGWLNQLLDQDEVLSSASMGLANGNGKRPAAQGWDGAWAAAAEEQVSQAAGAVSSLLDHDLQGTVHYAAPEDIRPSGAGGAPGFPLGPAADVFSLGYCIWEALGAQRPWAGMKAAALANSVGVKGARLPINRGWSLKLQGLMRRVWQADPAARPPANEVAGVLEAEICSVIGAV